MSLATDLRAIIQQLAGIFQKLKDKLPEAKPKVHKYRDAQKNILQTETYFNELLVDESIWQRRRLTAAA